MSNDLQLRLDAIYGLDIGFDVRFGVRGTKDAVVNAQGNDFEYVSGIAALAQELQRLFDLTPRGSFIDDPEYGVDLDFIGTQNDPRITVGLAKVAVLRALQHPSFADRFQVRSLEVTFNPQEDTALRVNGVLEVFGFEGVDLVRFGDYGLRIVQ